MVGGWKFIVIIGNNILVAGSYTSPCGVVSVEKCIFWKSKHLFPGSDSFFSPFFVSSAFHFKFPSYSVKVANWVLFVQLLVTYLRILDKCICKATQNEKWVIFFSFALSGLVGFDATNFFGFASISAGLLALCAR